MITAKRNHLIEQVAQNIWAHENWPDTETVLTIIENPPDPEFGAYNENYQFVVFQDWSDKQFEYLQLAQRIVKLIEMAHNNAQQNNDTWPIDKSAR